MSDFNTGGAVGGAASGAAIGTQVMPGWGTAIGAVAGGLLGGFMKDKSQEARDKAMALQMQLMKEIDRLPLPDYEKQRITLQKLSDAGFIDPEQLEGTEFENIQIDPKYKRMQDKAITEYEEIADAEGLDPRFRALANEQRRAADASAKAQEGRILASMAQRGQLDSGAQLAAQLAGAQASADRRSQEGDRLAANAFDARLSALRNLASTSQSARSQDFNEQSATARAKDIVNRFNANQRDAANRTNLGIRQSDINTANQQQKLDRDLERTQYQDQLDRLALKTGQYNTMTQRYDDQSQREARARQGMFDTVTNVGVGAIDAYKANQREQELQDARLDRQLEDNFDSGNYYSDERVKENVSDGSDKIRDMLDKLKAMSYSYKKEIDPSKEMTVGIMAQDLEKSDLGDTYVSEDENGLKRVSYTKMAPTLLASQVDINERLKKIEDLLVRSKK